MNYTDLTKSIAINGTVKCSIGSALVTSSLYTIAGAFPKQGEETKKVSWVQLISGVAEAGVGVAIMGSGAKELKRF